MALIDGVTGQDIATIASAGVMGLAAVVIVIALLRPKPPSPSVLKACLIVVALGMVTQLATKLIDSRQAGTGRVSVNLMPTARTWGTMVLPDNSGPLQARPRLWLDGGVRHCNPNASDFDPAARDCLDFSQQFDVAAGDGHINVSVDDLMTELSNRLKKMEAVVQSQTRGRADAIAGKVGGGESPIGEDGN